MSMSRRDVDSLYDSMRDAHSYIQSRRDGNSGGSRKSVTDKVVETLEVTAGAVGVGVLAGRLQTTSVGTSGVPLGLAIGFAGHAAAYFDLLGKHSDHLSNFANGAIAGWAAMWGAGQGLQMRQKAGLGTGPITAGNREPPQLQARVQTSPAAARPLTEAELAAMAARAR